MRDVEGHGGNAGQELQAEVQDHDTAISTESSSQVRDLDQLHTERSEEGE